jgi:RecB family exonuclease
MYVAYQKYGRLYVPGQEFKLSRSKLELFIQCPRCFYMDRRLGVSQPPGFPFTLNSAVDALLKSEFDIHRDGQTPHPLMKAYGLKAVPFKHPQMNIWRENFTGIQYYHEPTKLTITGAIDDLWMGEDGKLIIVDYKATSTTGELTLDAEYRQGYKRQMEIYQWLFRKNGYDVSDTGYFVYANGKKDLKAFDGRLEFDVKLIPYTGDDSWVEGVVRDAHACLNGELPSASKECQFCAYRAKARQFEK